MGSILLSHTLRNRSSQLQVKSGEVATGLELIPDLATICSSADHLPPPEAKTQRGKERLSTLCVDPKHWPVNHSKSRFLVKTCNGLISTVTPACLLRRNQIKSLNSTQLEFSFGVDRYFVFPLPQANRAQSKNQSGARFLLSLSLPPLDNWPRSVDTSRPDEGTYTWP